MAMIFYLILVVFSDYVYFSWGWFILSLIFSAGSEKKVIKYIYTNKPELDNEEIDT